MTVSFQKAVKSIKNKVDDFKKMYDPTIRLQDPKLESILNSDNKNIKVIKKELKKIDEELQKESSIDIFRIYQREFEKYFKEFKEIQKKYIHLKAVTEEEKKYYDQNKDAIRKIIQSLNSIEVITDNMKKRILQKCNHYHINVELPKEKNTTKKSDVEVEMKSATKDKLEVFKQDEKKPKIDLLKILKEMNSQVDDLHKRLLEAKQKKDATIDLYAIKDQIAQLKKQYRKYQLQIKDMKHHPRFVEVDMNQLMNSSKALDELQNMCQSFLEDKKPVNEVPFEELPVSKILLNHQKEVKEKEKYIVTEKEKGLISSSLNEDLKHCNEELSKIRNFVNRANPKLRNRAFLNGVSSYVKNMVKLSFSMFPVVLFKNRQIGTLTSCVLINNRIRMARKIVCDEKKELVYMEYNKIENQIVSKINCYVTIKNVLENSLDQLDKLQDEIEKKFRMTKDDKIVLEIQTGLSSMKGQLETMKQQINDAYNEEKENEKKKKNLVN